jgi:hypothetical protein
VDDHETLRRRLARLERIENPVSVAAGATLAIPYVLWWLAHGYIATYSWIIPFFIGGTISKFAFAMVEAKVAARLATPALPEAGVHALSEPEPERVEPIATAAPELAPPAPAPGEGPRLLKS